MLAVLGLIALCGAFWLVVGILAIGWAREQKEKRP